MKHLVLSLSLLLFGVVSQMAAQTVSRAPVPSQAHTMDKMSTSLGIIVQQIIIKNEIENEFADMAIELVQLHNDEVNAIVRRHIENVDTLNRKIGKLSKEKP